MPASCIPREDLATQVLSVYNKTGKCWASGNRNWRLEDAVLSPFVLLPDGLNGPLYRRITQEDLAKWRDAHKSDIRVVIGEGRVEVIVPSGLAREHKTTVSQVILAAQQQGYVMLAWDQYQKLLDEIGNLIGEDKESLPGAIVGIPVATTGSTQEVKVLPKSPPLDLRSPLTTLRP